MLVSLPGASPTLQAFVALVREYTRDHPELNRLVRGEESSDRQIAWAVLDALEDLNGTPPITYFSLDELLSRQQKSLLLRMTTIVLVESVGMLQTRNHINGSDGGTSTGVNDKTAMLMEWLRYFKGSVDQAKLRFKIANNISQILGPGNTGVHSEYWNLNQTYMAF